MHFAPPNINFKPSRSSAGLLKQGWSQQRVQAKQIFESQVFEFCLSSVILFNLLILVIETDITQDGQSSPVWLTVLNYMLLAMFTVELIVRVYVYRRLFFKDHMNLLDATVVLLDIGSSMLELLGEEVSGFSILRMLRVLRLARASVIVEKVPQLSMLVRSLVGALEPIFWGGTVLLFMLAGWGVLAVGIIHPLNERLTAMGKHAGCERCPRAYKSVWQSSLTIIQQIVAGDSWGSVTLPIIEEFPLSIVFFLLLFITIDVALMNVVLACVVDSANSARVEDLQSDKVGRKLLEICESMDEDGDGCLSFEEVEQGFAAVSRNLLKMDIREADIHVVFDILGVPKESESKISIPEFVNELNKTKTSSPHTMLVMIKHYVWEMRDRINENLVKLEKAMDVAAERELRVEEEVLKEEQMLEKGQELAVETLRREEENEELLKRMNMQTNAAYKGANAPEVVRPASAAPPDFAPRPYELDTYMDQVARQTAELMTEVLAADLKKSLKELEDKFDSTIRSLGNTSPMTPIGNISDPLNSRAGSSKALYPEFRWCGPPKVPIVTQEVSAEPSSRQANKGSARSG
jgi:voltage-gated sodium channel